MQAKRLDATTDFSRLRDMDAVLICVPTPLDERREAQMIVDSRNTTHRVKQHHEKIANY